MQLRLLLLAICGLFVLTACSSGGCDINGNDYSLYTDLDSPTPPTSDLVLTTESEQNIDISSALININTDTNTNRYVVSLTVSETLFGDGNSITDLSDIVIALPLDAAAGENLTLNSLGEDFFAEADNIPAGSAWIAILSGTYPFDDIQLNGTGHITILTKDLTAEENLIFYQIDSGATAHLSIDFTDVFIPEINGTLSGSIEIEVSGGVRPNSCE